MTEIIHYLTRKGSILVSHMLRLGFLGSDAEVGEKRTLQFEVAIGAGFTLEAITLILKPQFSMF